MVYKQPWLVPAITTWEALELSLQECVSIFCIENPIYSQIFPDFPGERFAEYRVDVFQEKQLMIMTKIKGENVFEEQKYEPCYLPLQWEDWHS